MRGLVSSSSSRVVVLPRSLHDAGRARHRSVFGSEEQKGVRKKMRPALVGMKEKSGSGDRCAVWSRRVRVGLSCCQGPSTTQAAHVTEVFLEAKSKRACAR